MNRKPLDTLEIPERESRKLRDRHRLAVGAGDPQFTLKLNAIADEYEAKAAQVDAKAASDKK